jgi:hypothetical protein
VFFFSCAAMVSIEKLGEVACEGAKHLGHGVYGVWGFTGSCFARFFHFSNTFLYKSNTIIWYLSIPKQTKQNKPSTLNKQKRNQRTKIKPKPKHFLFLF